MANFGYVLVFTVLGIVSPPRKLHSVHHNASKDIFSGSAITLIAVTCLLQLSSLLSAVLIAIHYEGEKAVFRLDLLEEEEKPFLKENLLNVILFNFLLSSFFYTQLANFTGKPYKRPLY